MQDDGDPEDPAPRLTDDDIRYCLAFLDARAIGRSAAVAKRWRRLAIEPALWLQQLERRLPGVAPAMAAMGCMDARALFRQLTRPERQPTTQKDVVVMLEFRGAVELVRTFELASLKRAEVSVEYGHHRPQLEYQLPLSEAEFNSIKRAMLTPPGDGAGGWRSAAWPSLVVTLLRKNDYKTVRLVTSPSPGGSGVWLWGAGLWPQNQRQSWSRNHIVDVKEFEALHTLEVELMVGMPGVGDHRPNPNSWGGPHFYVNEDFSSFDALSLYLKFEAKTAFDLTPSAEFNGDIFERSSQQRLVDLDDRLLSELAWS